jgi:soluble lytic murein transglycosylase-like protein
MRFTPAPRILAPMLGLLLLLPLSASARGAVYKWVDKQGVTHYTNVANDKAQSTGSTGGNASMSVVAETATAAPAVARDLRSHSTIYKFRDGAGITHYTDAKPLHRNYTTLNVYCPACDPRSKINWGSTRLNLAAFADSIDAASKEYGVDAALVRAIIHAESAFDPGAVSRKGAQGLMQLMPATAAQYGVSNAFIADQNIRAGTRHLASLLKSYNGDVRLTAAAYNAGEGAVGKYGGVPPYEETRVYVERVGVLHKRYQAGAVPAATTAPAAAATPVVAGS